ERTIDVHPGSMPVRDLDGGFEWIECARGHVAGLQGHDLRRSRVEGIERLAQRIDTDSTLIVNRNRLGAAETEISQREVDGFVPFGADEHVYSWRCRHSVAADVPANPGEHCAASGCRAGEVPLPAPRHEALGT